MLAGGVNRALRVDGDTGSAAPAAGLEDAAALAGLALTTDDAIWWVPEAGTTPARWHRVEAETADMTALAWAGDLLVAASGTEVIVVHTGDDAVERIRLDLPGRVESWPSDLAAVRLRDGRVRLAYVAYRGGSPSRGALITATVRPRSPEPPAVVVRDVEITGENHVALAPDGSRVAWFEHDAVRIAAAADGGRGRAVTLVERGWYSAPLAWTADGILTVSADDPPGFVAIDPATGDLAPIAPPFPSGSDRAVAVRSDLGVPAPGLGVVGGRGQGWAFCDLRDAADAVTCVRLPGVAAAPPRSVARTRSGTTVAVATVNGAGGAQDAIVVQPRSELAEPVVAPALAGVDVARLVAVP